MTQVQFQPTSAATRTTAPAVSVVIVNYRQWVSTARLVRTLARSASLQADDAEIVVVDNHSPYHHCASKVRRTPGLSLRRWGRNFGFARGVREGVRLSRGDWILLLNPDVRLDDGWLDRLHRNLETYTRDPRLGIIGFQLRNEDGSWQGCSGAFPSLSSTLAGLLRPRAWRKYRRSSRQRRASWVTGCAMLIRRECWQDLNGFDTDFFLYYEDVDLCRRARARAWTVGHEPDLEVIHLKPLHTRVKTPKLHVCTRHGLLTYARKHWPGWQFQILSWLIRAECWWRKRNARTAKAARALNKIVVALSEAPSRAVTMVRRFVNR